MTRLPLARLFLARLSLAGLLAAAMLCAAPARAADPASHWFVPPAPASGTSVDISAGNNTEAVTVIAKRASRSWRSVVVAHQNDPRASDAARPRQSFADQHPYCNAALRTVGGQPGTAADMITGPGAGRC